MVFDNHDEVPASHFSDNAWMSLVGLLNPVEFLVTVDHTRVWRHHLGEKRSTRGTFASTRLTNVLSHNTCLFLFIGFRS